MEVIECFILLFTLCVIILISRLVFVVHRINSKRQGDIQSKCRRKERIKTMIIAGSGGHTSEIVRLLSAMNENYSPREYVVANTDKMSEDKIRTAESERKSRGHQFSITKIPRSREVKQSYVTSVATTLYSSLYAFPIVFLSMPDLILVNGPGTCIPLCAAGFLLKARYVQFVPRISYLFLVLGLKDVQIIYVESFCRIETLSLSGLLMYHFADQMLVQWPVLQRKYPKTRYIGRLV